ncbi:hypothetical protein ACTAQI_00260 [Pseudarthrobacter sp. alpha12b]
MGMTRRGTWLRYGLVSAVLIGVHLGSLWFFSEGVYRGTSNVPLIKFPQEVDHFFVLTFTPTLIGLKYLAYDSAVRAFTKVYRPPALMVVFVAGYLVALAMDLAGLVAASKPMADSGFAILGAICQTPLVLVAAGGLIAATVLLKDRPPQTGPNPSPEF